MSRQCLFVARSVLAATLISFTFSALSAAAANPAATLAKDDTQAVKTWLAQADQFCAAIVDPEARSDAYLKLGYESGHAGELASARAAATKVTNPQSGIYALTFVARQYHNQGDADNAATLLKSARALAERNERNLTNFGHAHLVPALVELGMVDEARDYANSIADPVQRRLASREFIGALAKYDLLGSQVVEMTEADWSEVARAHAREGRVEQVHAAVERITNESGRDRAYAALVEKLSEQKRWRDAEPLIELIVASQIKDQAREVYLHAWGQEQSVEAIRARLAQVSSRAAKVALRDELISKLAAEDRIEEAEKTIEESIEAIQGSPHPEFVSKFGRFTDAHDIARQKSNYLITAKALARQGKVAAAQERLAWAEEPILALPSEAGLGRMMLILALVGAKIDLGELTSARRDIESVDVGYASPAAQLAKAYAKAGNAAEAIEVARLISADRKGRGHLYGKVAGELIRAGNDAAARQLLADLGQAADDADAYREAGTAMVESGKSDDLRNWLGEMPSAVHKALTCLGAAEAVRKSAAQQPAER